MKAYLLIALAATAATLMLFALPGPAAACDEFNLELNDACDSYSDSYGALGLNDCYSESLRLNIGGGYGLLALRGSGAFHDGNLAFRVSHRESFVQRLRRERLERELLRERLRQKQRQQFRARQEFRHDSRQQFRDGRPSVDIRLRRGLFGNRSAGRIRVN